MTDNFATGGGRIGNVFTAQTLAPGEYIRMWMAEESKGDFFAHQYRIKVGELENPLLSFRALSNIIRMRAVTDGVHAAVGAHVTDVHGRGMVWDDILEVLSSHVDYTELVRLWTINELRKYVEHGTEEEIRELGLYGSPVIWTAIAESRYVNVFIKDIIAASDKPADFKRDLWSGSWASMWVAALLNKDLTGVNRDMVMRRAVRDNCMARHMEAALGTLQGEDILKAYIESVKAHGLQDTERASLVDEAGRIDASNMGWYIALAQCDIGVEMAEKLAARVLDKKHGPSAFDVLFLFEIIENQDIGEKVARRVVELVGADTLVQLAKPLAKILGRGTPRAKRLEELLWKHWVDSGVPFANKDVVEGFVRASKGGLNKHLAQVALVCGTTHATQSLMFDMGKDDREVLEALIRFGGMTILRAVGESLKAQADEGLFNWTLCQLANRSLGEAIRVLEGAVVQPAIYSETMAVLMAQSARNGIDKGRLMKYMARVVVPDALENGEYSHRARRDV